MKLTFLGGAGTVTGSKTVVDTKRARLLLDCGLFQGFKHLRLKNRAPLPVPPASLAAVVLTHAHLDHCGWLPVLVRDGFTGPIFCSEPTAKLVEILLLDAAKLEEEQATWLAKKKSKHDPPLPLFTTADAEHAITRLRPAAFRMPITVADGVEAIFTPSGHILGASSVHIAADGRSVVFSGDVGRPNDPLMRAPEAPPAADLLVLESTYGARAHVEGNAKDAIATVARRTLERGGVLMIPTFAAGRAQAITHLLSELLEEGALPRGTPVWLNSPMAINVADVSCDFREHHRLTEAQCHAMCGLPRLVRTTEASKELNTRHGPMIVLAGSGMMTGGRILHHLKAWGGDARNTILLVGYQASGTRGDTLRKGAKTLRLFGEDIPIAAEVARIDGLSGHADAGELVGWLKGFSWRPQQVLLNHGEPEGADALRQHIERELGWRVRVASEGEQVIVGGEQ